MAARLRSLGGVPTDHRAYYAAIAFDETRPDNEVVVTSPVAAVTGTVLLSKSIALPIRCGQIGAKPGLTIKRPIRPDATPDGDALSYSNPSEYAPSNFWHG